MYCTQASESRTDYVRSLAYSNDSCDKIIKWLTGNNMTDGHEAIPQLLVTNKYRLSLRELVENLLTLRVVTNHDSAEYAYLCWSCGDYLDR